MSFPPSLVDIADSGIIAVIAWKLNIHYKLWRYKITVITASRAYLLQTPTCTRVIIQLHGFPNTNGYPVLLMLCSG